MINTAGWVKGLGLSVLVDTIAAVAPTHVVCIDSGNTRKDLPPGPFWVSEGASQVAQRLTLCPVNLGSWTPTVPAGPSASPVSDSAATTAPRAAVMPRPATEARNARFHAWVCCTLQAHPDCRLSAQDAAVRLYEERLSASAGELCACAPVAIDLAYVTVVSMFETLEPGNVAAALNGAFVGLATLPCRPDGGLYSPQELQVPFRGVLGSVGSAS